jgi:hypothetical protein
MPVTAPAVDTARPDAAVLNKQIRALCAGRVVWSAEALAELGRLRGEWQAAVAAEEQAACTT